MNLESLNVVELEAPEMREIEAGGKIARWLGMAIGYTHAKMEQAADWFSETMEYYAPTKG